MDLTTKLNPEQLEAVTATEGLKALFGHHFVHQEKWVRNIVENQ